MTTLEITNTLEVLDIMDTSSVKDVGVREILNAIQVKFMMLEMNKVMTPVQKEFCMKRLNKGSTLGASVVGVNDHRDLKQMLLKAEVSKKVGRIEQWKCDVFEVSIPEGYAGKRIYARRQELSDYGLIQYITAHRNPHTGAPYHKADAVAPFPTNTVTFLVNDSEGLENWFAGVSLAFHKTDPSIKWDVGQEWIKLGVNGKLPFNNEYKKLKLI